MPLNYHHLMYFREIALQGSVSKAAEKLHIGQPALSGQLKLLEEALGHRLFERANRRLTLTEAGKYALQRANEIHKSGTTLVDVMGNRHLSSTARLTIGVLDSVPKHLILKLIRDARGIGDCRVTVLEGRIDDLLRDLKAHVLDILISNHHAPVGERGGIYSRPLARSPVGVFGAPRFRALRRGFPASLDRQPFVLPTFDSKLRHDVEHYFKLHDLQVEVFTETQDTSVQKLVGTEGYGLIPLPEFSVRELIRDRKLVELGVMDGVYEEFWLISGKRIIENPVAARLIREFEFSLP